MRNLILPLRVLLTASCVALFSGAGLAADDVSIKFKDRQGTFDIYGSFQVKADSQIVWEVLTDYQRIPKFVGALKVSLLMENLDPYHIRLKQEFEGGFLFFTKRVRVELDVLELPYRGLLFTDMDGRDFSLYQGAWMIDLKPGGIMELHYRLLAKQKFEVPFAGDFMNGGVKDLLSAVRREILRRQSQEDKKSGAVPILTQKSEELAEGNKLQ